ncbi:MAG: Crp/Fnr family transcriptional regulator [Bacteroidota bacterium]
MQLIHKIETLTQLSAGAKDYLLQHTERFSYKKNEELLRNGKVCNYLFFINAGFMRGYYLLENKEVTNWLATENDFCTSYYSLISRGPSYETIECIEKCEVEAVSYATLNKVYTLFPETERVGRLILEDYYCRLEERLISIQFKSARERYEMLFKTRPELLNRAPLGYLASYLGITQETLSRIRADL